MKMVFEMCWKLTTEGEITSEAEETAQAEAWRPRRVWSIYELLVVAGALWAWGRLGRVLSLISNGASIFLEDCATVRDSVTRLASLLSRDSSNYYSCQCYK